MSGNKRVVFNTLERAVSTDLNRLQSFGSYSLEELAKWLFDALTSAETAGSVVTTGNGVEVPARACVINGICPFIPAGVGGIDIFITSGLLFVNDFDSPINTDISIYKYVEDLGISTLGTLLLTPNASGLARVDVIECQRVPNVVLESDNRDIFNNVTGMFTAGTVPKVERDQLTYRIRTGTPGAGFPGSVAGWLPLAVMQVPAGANVLDTCELWDVRPLLSDLANCPISMTEAFPLTREASSFRESCPSAGPSLPAIGTVEMVLGDRIVGGPFVIDPASSDYAEPGAGPFLPGVTYHIYQATFYGLPRWARYTTNPVAMRIPVSPRGVTIVTQKGCDSWGAPLAAFPLIAPAITGFTGGGALTLSARCIYTGFVAFTSGDFVGTVTDDKETVLDERHDGTRGGALVPVASTGTSVTYAMSDDIQHPGNATHVRVRFRTRLTSLTTETIVESSVVSQIGVDWLPISGGFYGQTGTNTGGANVLVSDLKVEPGETLIAVRAWVRGVLNLALPVMPILKLFAVIPHLGIAGQNVIATAVDPSPSSGVYNTIHPIDITGIAFTPTPANSKFAITVFAESGGNAVGMSIFGFEKTVTRANKALSLVCTVSSLDPTGAKSCWEYATDFTMVEGLDTNVHEFEVEIPLFPNVVPGTGVTRLFTINYTGAFTFVDALGKVCGWKTR